MADKAYEVEDEFLLIGRTFEEYRRMFDLAVDDVCGNRILDCGGGVGAFTAVASSLGADVTATDPIYGPPASTLEPACDEAVERTVEQLCEKRDAFVWEYYGDPETRGRFLRAAYERFLADYARNPDRYVAAELPGLPFASDAFDLALAGNLLFLYDDRLDRSFHADALRELTRVAREVRTFPLHALDGDRSALVEPLIDELRANGHGVETRDVPYEFRPGATEMLVVGGR